MFFGRKKKNKKEESLLDKRPRLDLHPETKKTVWGIIFFTLTLVIILSFVGQAGRFGDFFGRVLAAIFGWGKFLVPFVSLAASLIFFKSEKRNVYFSTFLGGFLLISAVLGVLEIVGKITEPERRLGGIWGEAFAFLSLKFLGEVASLVIFGSVLIIAILIFFNAPLKKIKGEEGSLKSKEGKERAEFEKKEEPEDSSKVLSKIKNVFQKQKDKEGGEVLKKPRGDEKDIEKFILGREETKGVSYRFPSIELLASDTERPTSGDIRANANVIKRTLLNFGIDVEMGEVNIGPTVTQYTLKPAEGMKLSRITALQNDLALALAAHPLRMEAPIPGKSLVGLEIPNKSVALVRLRNLIDNPNFLEAPSNLAFPLGRDVSGTPIYTDLKRMPHMLIAGSTGSGKTIALNCLIVSLLYRNSPEMLRLLLIDPKRVEFPVYNDIPHLLAPVITDAQKTVLSLRWLVQEMERRFGVLSEAKARDISTYNSQIQRKNDREFIPYIVVIIDELADLMASRGKEIEAGIVRLAQMARAVGIHLVVATQRPSVEVITGLIKANITSRIAFQVASQVDSRTIMDMAGAEKLLGAGDMLFISAEVSKPRRIQGSYVSDKEVKRLTDWIANSNQGLESGPGEEIFSPNLLRSSLGSENDRDFINFEGLKEEFSGESASDEELYEEAKKLAIRAKKASASFLQRRLRLGYARAARIIDMLEERGVVGPGEGAKPREVYMSEDENLESRK